METIAAEKGVIFTSLTKGVMIMMDKKDPYVSPSVNVIAVENSDILCASAEGYGMSGYVFDEDDWS